MKTTMTCMAAAAIAWATGGPAWGCDLSNCENTEAPPEARAVIACGDSQTCDNTETPPAMVADCDSSQCNTDTPPVADAKAA